MIFEEPAGMASVQAKIPSIAILPLPNFTLNAFASFVDVLRLAADEGDRSRQMRLSWDIIAPSLQPVRSSCGVEIVPWQKLGDPARFDYIVVCGGLLRRRHNEDEIIEEFLRRAGATDAVIIGLCTGSFTLAQAGLLESGKACISWNHVSDFQEEFPDVEVVASELYVVHGKRVTCAGGAGSADMAAWIVERHGGAGLARKALDIMQIEGARTGNAPQTRPPVGHDVRDERLRKAILLMEEKREESIVIAKLADAVGLSSRQLERLFIAETGQTPTSFLASMRIAYAHWLLQSTAKSITQIAGQCGFADTAHFCRRYKATYGVRPTAMRQGDHNFFRNELRPYPDAAN